MNSPKTNIVSPSRATPQRRALSTLLLACLLAIIVLPARSHAQAAGSEDATYQKTQFLTGVNPAIDVISLDPATGKAVVGGYFYAFFEPPPINARTNLPAVARVNTDGTVDKSFASANSLGPPSSNPTLFGVFAVAVQPDSSVIVGGNFTVADNVTHNNIARLLSNGMPDIFNNKNLGSGADGQVTAVALQADGKILVGGDFKNFNGSPAPGLVRLNADLTRDTSFVLDTTKPVSYRASALFVQPDGRILFLGGVNTGPRRLTASGALVTSFDTSGVKAASGGGDLSDGSSGTALALQADGKVLAPVLFTATATGGSPFTYTRSIVRLNSNGTLDTSFDFSPKISISATNTSPVVRAIVAQPDGTVVFGGDGGTFDSVGGLPRRSVVRLLRSGLVDGSFNVTTFSSGGINDAYALALQADGKLLVGGNARLPLGRLNDLTISIQHPAFFNGEAALSNGVFYLEFPNGAPFGYYSYLSDPRYIFHFDLGYEYLFDANDGKGGIYFYDFTSGSFFYTSPSFGFPYLYDFSLGATLYYYPQAGNPGRYTTNPRYFFNFKTGQIITK